MISNYVTISNGLSVLELLKDIIGLSAMVGIMAFLFWAPHIVFKLL